MDWSDIQITNDNPATPVFDPVILNAGAAHSTGVELELNASISEHFEAFASFALQDAKYDEGTLPGGEALDAIPFAPRYTADLGGEYRVPLERGELKFGADVVLRGESYLDLVNSPDGKVRPYQMFNARVGYAAPDARWSVTLWGKNLSDETVKQRLFDLTDQDVIGQSFVALNDPRTYGITVRYGF
jgi:iron complex outermembrane receptor protein